MKKKIITLLMIVGGLLSFSFADFGLKVAFDKDELNNYIKSISHVHFKYGGNDFWGIFVFDSTEDVGSQGEKIMVEWEEITCYRKLKGLYYNSERGQRLWPLDKETQQHFNISETLWITGGLYTSCTGNNIENPYGIYGYLEHTYHGHTFWLMAGLKYNPNQNTLLNNKANFSQNFGFFDNKYPVGVVYDNNGGLGFVWCTLSETNTETANNTLITELNTTPVTKLFTYASGKVVFSWNNHTQNVKLNCENIGLVVDSLLLLKIQGIIGVSNEVSQGDLKNIAGNESDSKSQYFASVNVNNATMINFAKKKSGEICNNEWKNNFDQNKKLNCIENQNITVDVSKIAGKTLVVKKGNLTLIGNLAADADPLDIFVDGGKLVLNPTISKKNFNEKGYITTNANEKVYEGLYLKGNFVVNGIVEEKTEMKYFIHGKFTSLNTYASPTKERLDQVKSLLGDTTLTEEDINLVKVFKWRCNYGKATDNQDCTTGEFRNAPLVIINQNFQSNLFS